MGVSSAPLPELFKQLAWKQLSGQQTERARDGWPFACIGISGGEMAGENRDDLENRLKEATAEDSGQMLEEFLKAFYVDRSEAAVDRQPAALADPEAGT